LKEQNYDLIGDIHGHANELEALLQELGYSLLEDCYRHPDRQVIFLGDFIDRGPSQRGVMGIVIPMVENGSALAVMGNHEFNALAFHTADPNKTGSWLRQRNDKNIRQHIRFLDEFLGEPDELERVLGFFVSLPLWLDLDGLRVVHACWSEKHIATLGSNRMTKELLCEASEEGTPAYDAIEVLLKGVEHELPDGRTFKDKDGYTRSAIRTCWWVNKDSLVKDIAIVSDPLPAEVGNTSISKRELGGYDETQKPVFVGHYWRTGKPRKLSDNVACLDYSVANKGKLVAYRWSGEKTLSDDNFTYLN
jgi:hypothetical protein